MALSSRRRRAAVPPAGSIRVRPPVVPPANAGLLNGLENAGKMVAWWADGTIQVNPGDLEYVLGTLRSCYRIAKSLRPVAG